LEVFSAELVREGDENVLRVNAHGLARIPSIEDDALFMGKAVDLLIQHPSTTKIVFEQQRDFEYPYAQVRLLKELAIAYQHLVKQSDQYSVARIKSFGGTIDANRAYAFIHSLIFNTFRDDPAGSYVLLKRFVREQRIELDRLSIPADSKAHYRFITLLEHITEVFEQLEIIKKLKAHLAGHEVGSRKVYGRVFEAGIKPDFLFTKLMASYPRDGREVAS